MKTPKLKQIKSDIRQLAFARSDVLVNGSYVLELLLFIEKVLEEKKKVVKRKGKK